MQGRSAPATSMNVSKETMQALMKIARAISKGYKLGPMDAEDLMQDCFARLAKAKRIVELLEPGNENRLLGYAFRTMLRSWAEFMHNEQRERIARAEWANKHVNRTDQLFTPNEPAAWARFVMGLTNNEKAVLRMLIWEGREYHEIAEGLGMTRSAVYQCFYRALTKIRNRYPSLAEV